LVSERHGAARAARPPLHADVAAARPREARPRRPDPRGAPETFAARPRRARDRADAPSAAARRRDRAGRPLVNGGARRGPPGAAGAAGRATSTGPRAAARSGRPARGRRATVAMRSVIWWFSAVGSSSSQKTASVADAWPTTLPNSSSTGEPLDPAANSAVISITTTGGPPPAPAPLPPAGAGARGRPRPP